MMFRSSPHLRPDAVTACRAALANLPLGTLLALPLEQRLQLAATAQSLWHLRVGVHTGQSMDDVKQHIRAHVDTHGDAKLIEDIELGGKALAALPLSSAYRQALGSVGYEIATLAKQAGGAPMAIAQGAVATQEQMWKSFSPALFDDMPPFTVHDDPARRFDFGYDRKNGSIYIGPAPDGRPHFTAGDPARLAGFVGHEQQHHVQHHMATRFLGGKVHDERYADDAAIFANERRYGIPSWPTEIFDLNDDPKAQKQPLFVAAYTHGYRARPTETASFMLEEAVKKEMQPGLQPQGPASGRRAPPVIKL